MTIATDDRRRRPRPVEDRLTAALRDTALNTVPDTLVPPRWLDLPQVGIPPRRPVRRYVAMGLAAAAVVALAVALTRALPSAQRKVHVPIASHTFRPAPKIAGHFCDNFVVDPCQGGRGGYEPLWPFTNYPDARAWRDQHLGERATAWQFDPKAVVDTYLRQVLGLKRMTMIEYPGDSGDPRAVDLMSVDFGYGNGSAHPQVAGNLLLARYGPNRTYPWEVIGDDRSAGFKFTTPLRGAAIGDPVGVSGHGAPPNAIVSVEVVRGTTGLPVGSFRADATGTWAGEVAVPPAVVGSPSAPVDRQVITLVATARQSGNRPPLIAIRAVHAR